MADVGLERDDSAATDAVVNMDDVAVFFDAHFGEIDPWTWRALRRAGPKAVAFFDATGRRRFNGLGFGDVGVFMEREDSTDLAAGFVEDADLKPIVPAGRFALI
jgi:hypothetical protein